MKKIFLCTMELHGYEKVIKRELERKGYFVELFDYNLYYNQNKKIKNIFKRVLNNVYYKIFLKKDLKILQVEKKFEKEILKKVNEGEIFLKIGAIKLSEETLKIIKRKFKRCISHYWDSIAFFLNEEEIELEKKYFDKISTYDRKDSENYKLYYLPNFYQNKMDNYTGEIDAYTLIAYTPKRKEVLEKIANEFIQMKKTYSISLKISEKRKEQIKSKLINLTTKSKNVEKMLLEMAKAKIIIEILRESNSGCTFRTIDCIGMKKKLITNNKLIIDEEFYNPNNILVINEDEIEIPEEFIDSPYEELPKEIYEKYSLENWIKQLLDVR